MRKTAGSSRRRRTKTTHIEKLKTKERKKGKKEKKRKEEVKNKEEQSGIKQRDKR